MKFFNRYTLRLLILAGAFTVLNLLNCITIKIQCFSLSENQILYIYSSLAQILGALLGLIIAGYGIIDSKLKSNSVNDPSTSVFIDDIRDDCFKSLLCIIVLSVANIITCFMVLMVYENNFTRCGSFFMAEATILFMCTLYEIIKFVLYLKPSALNEKSSKHKEAIDAEYASNDTAQSDHFSPFITYYNLLEALLKEFAIKLLNSSQEVYKLQIFDALDILLRKEIITRKLYSMIDEFRDYRNALVHSLDYDKTVSPRIFKELEELYNLLKNVYETYSEDPFNNPEIKKLHEFAEKHGYSETDYKILEYLKNNENASLSNIANNIKHSTKYTHHRLGTLQDLGLIYKIGSGRQSCWRIK